jgi:succinate dehydrogenase flavin-adding protein (antitoxin of CptAB toxin-antitoxin module)
MIGLHRIREQFHGRVLRLRKIEHTLHTVFFERLFADSNKEEIANLEEILKGDDHARLLKWMRGHRTVQLGEKSMRALREIAQRAGITNWSRLSKMTLISLIGHKESEYAEAGDAGIPGTTG